MNDISIPRNPHDWLSSAIRHADRVSAYLSMPNPPSRVRCALARGRHGAVEAFCRWCDDADRIVTRALWWISGAGLVALLAYAAGSIG